MFGNRTVQQSNIINSPNPRTTIFCSCHGCYFFYSLEIQGPFILAVDATPVIPSLKVHGNKIFGLAQRVQVVVKSAEDIIRVVEDTSLEKTKLLNAFVIAPVHLSEPFYVLDLSPVMKGENSQTMSCWFDQAVQMAVENNLPIIGIGADGDSKVRKFYMDTYIKKAQETDGLTLDFKGFDFAAVVKHIGTTNIAATMQPDWRHLIKKWRNQLPNTKKILLMVKNLVIMEHLIKIYETYKLESGLWKSDVFVRDKQNVDAATRLLQPAVRDCLIKSHSDSTRGLRAYLSVGSCLLRCYADNEISVRERAKLAWTPVIFLRLWKIWISSKQYDSETHFISDQTYTDTILAGHSLILNMLIFSKYFPDVPFCPSFFGSDA